jgi:hypothetical protein
MHHNPKHRWLKSAVRSRSSLSLLGSDGVLLAHPVEVRLLLVQGHHKGMVGVHVLQLGQVSVAHLPTKKLVLKLYLWIRSSQVDRASDILGFDPSILHDTVEYVAAADQAVLNLVLEKI